LIQGRFARNAGWMMLGQCSNFFTQALYFILLARLLQVREYGTFAAAFALVNIVSPYSALGANMLFMRYVTKDRSVAGIYWGNSMVVMSVSSLLLLAVLTAAGPLLTHVRQPLVFVILVIANCLFLQLTQGAGAIFRTFEKMRHAAGLDALANVLRLLTVGILWLTLHRATVLEWCLGVLCCTGVSSAVAVTLVWREIGRPHVDFGIIRKRLGEGFGFAFAGTTQSVYNDVDKTMLGHYGMTVQNGIYTLAYRVVDFATSPIAALDYAVLPRYFKLSHISFAEVVRLARRTTLVATGIGLAISLCTHLVAPLLPPLVGHGFAEAVVALHWLCWLPPIRAIHRLMGGVLTSTGNQNLRTLAQFLAGGFNFLLNLWLIPAHGWLGAAWSSVATDGILAVMTVAGVMWLRHSFRQEHRSENEVAVELSAKGAE
jgi:O-antigen/teichoic acid export membrane protein